MKIKFSSTGSGDDKGPYIKFGSGHFKVDNAGNLTAEGGGTIARWTIGDYVLYNADVGMNSNPNNSKYPSITGHNSKAFFANNSFYVTHDGYLFSTSGKIGGWNITNKTLYQNNVGMNADSTNQYDPNGTSNNTNLKTNNGNMAFWAGAGASSGNNIKNFYVTHDGYLFSKSGNIAGWAVSEKSF